MAIIRTILLVVLFSFTFYTYDMMNKMYSDIKIIRKKLS